MEEKDIIIKLINGKKEYFNILVDKVKKRLYVIAYSRLQNKLDAEDAVQETLFEVYKNIKKLKEYEKFNSWITTILINKCNYIYRKNKRNLNTFKEQSYLYDYNQIQSDNVICDIENKLYFFNLLNCLELEDRTLIAMFYSDEYSSKEISNILNINENTIRSKLKRARDKIKYIIERGEENE